MTEPPLSYEAWAARSGPSGVEDAIAQLISGTYPTQAAREAWWTRRRSLLNGRTPRQALADGDEQQLYELARSLVAGGAT